MKSLPMMKVFDPEEDYKPIVPKAVSLSCSLGGHLTFSCMQSEAMAHFFIIFFRQTEKETVVSVEKQVKDLLQVCHTSGTSRMCLHG